LGLAVNIASAWLLSSGGHHHGHSHGGHDDNGHDENGHDEAHLIATPSGDLILEVFEDGVPPRFRLRAAGAPMPFAETTRVVTERPDGSRQTFSVAARGDFLESIEAIPEPHAFTAEVLVGADVYTAVFEEHTHGYGAAGRDNNMRAAIIHVIADATVSVLVIVGLLLARAFGWLWMDPLAGIIGACVIASWSYGLIRDTGAILLDRIPDSRLAKDLRNAIECDGSTLADLHLWRLGPGHLGAIVSVCPTEHRTADYYRAKLGRFRSLSHVTIEIHERRNACTDLD
jgi:cation diffusion facilitator family transporter